MSKRDKLIERFKRMPKDFEWSEMVNLLEGFGYQEQTNDGSSRKFLATDKDTILMHKPHPEKIIKMYILKQVKEKLQKEGLI